MATKVETFLRIRPTKCVKDHYELIEEDNEIHFQLHKNVSSFNSEMEQTQMYKYGFKHIFNEDTQQDEIFSVVGEKAIDKVMSGYNATIFAYGQTSSGKTHTLTGPPDGQYEDRGLVPRSILNLFQKISEQSSENTYEVFVSYLQIYKHRIHDLLTGIGHEEELKQNLDDLKQVQFYNTSEGFQFPDLSLHRTENAAHATKLMWQGDTQRIIAETPMNKTSTRSHCIFSLYVQRRNNNSAVFMESKLHLVDLAGSERVWKNDINGDVLQQAKFINGSLFSLQRVVSAIVAQQQAKDDTIFVPYRDSVLTIFLKDALGGNSFTQMIATITSDPQYIMESLSTCDFARNVNSISNVSRRVQKLDIKELVKHLKQQVKELKRENNMLKDKLGHNVQRGAITESEKERFKEKILGFIAAADPETDIERKKLMDWLPFNMESLHEVQYIWRYLMLAKGGVSVAAVPLPRDDDDLRGLLEQRDTEIEVLCDLNRKQSQKIFDLEETMKNSGTVTPPAARPNSQPSPTKQKPAKSRRPSSLRTKAVDKEVFGPRYASDLIEGTVEYRLEFLDDKKAAFDFFQNSYTKMTSVKKDKDALKKLVIDAKALGEVAREQHTMFLQAKNEYAKVKKRESITGEQEPKSMIMLAQLQEAKREVSENAKKLNQAKIEVSALTQTIEEKRKQMHNHFAIWFRRQTDLIQAEIDGEEEDPGHPANYLPPKPMVQQAVAPLKLEKNTDYTTPNVDGIVVGDEDADKSIAEFMKLKQMLLKGSKRETPQ
ncbi:hypothetical protein PCE1_004179 [Barthelona sp. PCE]